jgi:hypothetical protein
VRDREESAKKRAQKKPDAAQQGTSTAQKYTLWLVLDTRGSPSFRASKRETRNPGVKDWIPAGACPECSRRAGMTDRGTPAVSDAVLSAPAMGELG